jgi:hypothetical protein
MQRYILSGLSIIVLVTTVQSRGATVTFHPTIWRTTTAAEVADGAPAGGTVSNYFITTDADILGIRGVNVSTAVEASLFQHNLGSDSEPPPPPLVAAFPSLGADSWITTPGPTAIAHGTSGGGFGHADATWFDTTDDGPQTDFQFARLTVPAGVFGAISAT